MAWVEKIIGWLMMVWSDKKNMKCKRGNAIKNKRKQVFQLWHLVIFQLYLELQALDWDDSWTILKLRDRSTFGMKTSKSSSVVFLVKKLKYRSQSLLSKADNRALTSQWYFDHILVLRAPNWIILDFLER